MCDLVWCWCPAGDTDYLLRDAGSDLHEHLGLFAVQTHQHGRKVLAPQDIFRNCQSFCSISFAASGAGCKCLVLRRKLQTNIFCSYLAVWDVTSSQSPGPSPLSLLAAPSSAAGKRALLGCLGLTVKKVGSSPRHWTHVCGPSINFGTGELQHKPAWGEDTVALYRTREWMPGIPGKLGCYLCQVKLQLAMR